MIAALQMYDWPEAAHDNDLFWRMMAIALRTADIDAPLTLSRPEDMTAPWRDPGLILGQTCGLPFVTGMCGDALLVARPVYNVHGCGRDDEGRGLYSSAIVVRRGGPNQISGLRGRCAAINDFNSQSGCNALADSLVNYGTPFFGSVRISGSHRASALAVAEGTADVAAIDAVSWALFAETEPEAHAELKVISWTKPMPTLPFITGPAMQNHIPLLRAALSSTSTVLDPTVVPRSVGAAKPEDYRPILGMKRRVEETFGPNLESLAQQMPHVPA